MPPMNKHTHEQGTQAANCLIEGCSICATVRMMGIVKKAVMRLLREVGGGAHMRCAFCRCDVCLRGFPARLETEFRLGRAVKRYWASFREPRIRHIETFGLRDSSWR